MNTLVYQPGSDTIRQMPQNYLIAHWEKGNWHMEPDLAADIDLVILVTRALMIYELKFEQDGNLLLAKIEAMPAHNEWINIELSIPENEWEAGYKSRRAKANKLWKTFADICEKHGLKPVALSHQLSYKNKSAIAK
jgi:hypothetical protein